MKNPDNGIRIIAAPRAYYAVVPHSMGRANKGTWRRITLKASRNSTARTERRNLARIVFATKHGFTWALKAPAAV